MLDRIVDFILFFIPRYTKEFMIVERDGDSYEFIKPLILLEDDEDEPEYIALMSVFKFLFWWRVRMGTADIITWNTYLKLAGDD